MRRFGKPVLVGRGRTWVFVTLAQDTRPSNSNSSATRQPAPPLGSHPGAVGTLCLLPAAFHREEA